MTELEKRVKAWADLRFGPRDIPGRLRKLGEEYGELAQAAMHFDPQTGRGFHDFANEAADVALVLTDMLALHGVSLHGAMWTKLESNEKRSANYQDIDGRIKTLLELQVLSSLTDEARRGLGIEIKQLWERAPKS